MNNRSNKAVSDFFSTLLDDKGVIEELQQKPLEQLLAQVTPVEPLQELSTQVIDPALLFSGSQDDLTTTGDLPTVESTSIEQPIINSKEQKELQKVAAPSLAQELDDVFPVLYFSISKYTFAVPLIKLKAIHRLKKPTKIFGKPAWFSGIQVERKQNLAIVDTARYLMPEKFNSCLEHSTNYKYIIVLGDSNWGLTCDLLVDSENLSKDAIKWRTKGTTNPWLAGTVKQRMCGLLAVDALIELFEQNTSV